MKHQTISISEANSWLACRKKHEYRYRQQLVPAEEKRPLTLGKSVHIGLESIYETGKVDHALQSAGEYLAHSTYAEELTPLVYEMLRGYCEYRKEDPELYEVLYIELPFKLPLISPSGRASRIFDIVGRVDMVVRRKSDGTIWLFEHKTVGTKDRNYFNRLDTDYQVRAYAWAVSRFLGMQVKGVVYNVLRTKLPAEPDVLKSGKISKRANIDTTLEVFEAALSRTGSDPSEYADILDRLRNEGNTFFLREEREFTPEELHQWALDFYFITRDIRNSGSPYRNPASCTLYGGCEFRELCAGLLPADEIHNRYRHIQTKHPELSDVDLDSLKPAKHRPSEPTVNHEFIESIIS